MREEVCTHSFHDLDAAARGADADGCPRCEGTGVKPVSLVTNDADEHERMRAAWRGEVEG